ncbi:GFA family protein [Paracoccus denitrificans]|uniref:GFA family protein n=1 Tax=Paracoccus denitrificans TaxID=266 RepID=UPI000CEBDD7F|nr:GFA family protein [Paracoccus denitrificans]
MSRQHYKGGCQCGSVAYEVDADLDKTFTCNCSRCQRLGFVLTFVPKADFHLTSDGPVTEYLFNRKQIRHRFCPTCGVESYALGQGADGVEMVAVNVNCLEGVNPRELASQAVDGASY